MKISKVKAKVEQKVDAAKAKIADKCGKANTAAKAAKAIVAACLFGALAGCATADAPTAQRAQTVTAKDINFTFNMGGGKDCAGGEGCKCGGIPATFTFEIATAAQANETSGTETMTATPTQTPTNDVKPDIDVTVPVNKAGAGQSVGSALGDAAAGMINGLMKGDAKAGAASASCPDGNCTVPGACPGGNCSE